MKINRRNDQIGVMTVAIQTAPYIYHINKLIIWTIRMNRSIGVICQWIVFYVSTGRILDCRVNRRYWKNWATHHMLHRANLAMQRHCRTLAKSYAVNYPGHILVLAVVICRENHSLNYVKMKIFRRCQCQIIQWICREWKMDGQWMVIARQLHHRKNLLIRNEVHPMNSIAVVSITNLCCFFANLQLKTIFIENKERYLIFFLLWIGWSGPEYRY